MAQLALVVPVVAELAVEMLMGFPAQRALAVAAVVAAAMQGVVQQLQNSVVRADLA
jgi:hypothetical protein